jgi:hypothetical protein
MYTTSVPLTTATSQKYESVNALDNAVVAFALATMAIVTSLLIPVAGSSISTTLAVVQLVALPVVAVSISASTVPSIDTVSISMPRKSGGGDDFCCPSHFTS